MKFLLLSSLLATASAAGNKKVLLVGDSWAEKAGTPFAEVLKKHDSPLTVVNKGIGGSTAKQWAENKNSVKSLVELHGGEDVEFIWVRVFAATHACIVSWCLIAGLVALRNDFVLMHCTYLTFVFALY